MISFVERYNRADTLYQNLTIDNNVNAHDCIDAATIFVEQADSFDRQENYDGALNELFKSKELTQKQLIGRPSEASEIRAVTLRKIVEVLDKQIQRCKHNNALLKAAEMCLVKASIVSKKSIGDYTVAASYNFKAVKLFSRILLGRQTDQDSYLDCYKIVEFCHVAKAVINKRCKAAVTSDPVDQVTSSLDSLNLSSNTFSVYQNSLGPLTDVMKQAIVEFKRSFNKKMNTLLAEKKFLEAASVCEAVSKVMEIDVFPGMRFNFFRKRAECKRLAQLHSHELT